MSALDLLAEELSKKVLDQILSQVSQKISGILPEITKVSYNEKEAATVLNISPVTLAEKRKNGEIDFCQIISPRRGDSHGGKFVYMRHHLLDYMLRNEVRNGKQLVSFADVNLTGKLAAKA
jgi:hypothetical protein